MTTLNTFGHVPNLHADFVIAALPPSYVPQFHALMEKVKNDLPEDEKHFLKPLSLTDLHEHAHKGNMLAVIEKTTGQLAGGLLLTPVDKACGKTEDKFPGFPTHLMSQDTAVIKVFVDKEQRGKGHMGALVSAGKERAAELNLDLVAKVAVKNTGSNAGFKNADFNKAAMGQDPVLGYAVHYWHKECPALATSPVSRLNGQHDNQPVLVAAPAC